VSEKRDKTAFEAGAEQPDPGFFAELWDFIKTSKKWWLTPIILMLVVIGALIVLGQTAAGPFIYALF
jgi:hypothetical protein